MPHVPHSRPSSETETLVTGSPDFGDAWPLIALIADHVPLAVGYVDPTQHFRFVNAAFREWFALPEEAVVGNPLETIIGGLNYRVIEPQLRRVQAGEVCAFEGSMVYPARGLLRVRCACVPHRSGAPAPYGFFLITEDVTTAEEAEEARREGEALLQLIIDHVPSMVAYVDNGGRFRFVNDAFARWLGKTRDLLVGKRAAEEIAQDHLAACAPSLDDALRGEQTAFEGAALRRDGDERTLRSACIPFADQGAVRGVFIVSEDITELRNNLEAMHAHERQLQLLADNVPALICYIDRDERYRLANRALADWFGRQPADILGCSVEEILGSLNYENVKDRLARALAGEILRFEDTLELPGRGTCHNDVAYVPHFDNGAVRGAFVTRTDVSRLKEVEEELRTTVERFDLAMGAADEGVWDWDLEEDAIWHSGRSRALIGLPHLRVEDGDLPRETPESWFERVVDEDRERVRDAVREHIAGSELLNIEYRVGAKPAEERWLQTKGRAVRDPDGRALRIVGATHDISHRKGTEVELAQYAAELRKTNRELALVRRELEHQALSDPLTGLPNRRLFQERLMLAVELTKREAQAHCLLLIDLDGFKAVNDTRGHEAGDAVLKGVAEGLLETCRKADTVARLGGDEFVVLMQTGVTVTGAIKLAQKLLERISEPIPFGDQVPLSVGASVGIACVTHDDAADVDETIRRADQAMYQAKSCGGGYAVYGYPKGVVTPFERHHARDAEPSTES